ncbi:hypothetical protein [Agarilytica rhodophyticola]|uniref:hypothetical protein n=1 Tax=Agarilytica rhodophyticola TaxID=1737490 RepID=UPI001319C11D|nr:hypothetical protein [Agarilytica rhodophyticola]
MKWFTTGEIYAFDNKQMKLAKNPSNNKVLRSGKNGKYTGSIRPKMNEDRYTKLGIPCLLVNVKQSIYIELIKYKLALDTSLPCHDF